jgi:hypothetical protein
MIGFEQDHFWIRSLRKFHPSQERLEAGVRVQGIEGWLTLHEKHVASVLRVGFLEPLQGLIFVPQSRVTYCNPVRRTIVGSSLQVMLERSPQEALIPGGFVRGF